MFKLSMVMCSAVMASCYPELLDKGIYENYYLCAIDGYQTSIFALQELGEEMVKEKQIYIKFSCTLNELI